MILAIVLIPLLAAALVVAVRHSAVRRVLLVGTALTHSGLVTAVLVVGAEPVLGGWLALDGPGTLFLAITSAVFLASALYAVGYLRREPAGARPDFEEAVAFVNEPDAALIACLLCFLAAMSLVTVSQHLGLLWVAVEATTLASTPMVYFHRHHRSLEAAWKYLLIGSVGIGLALLGTLFLAVAGGGGEGAPSLHLDSLLEAAGRLEPIWLEGAFILLLVGYGTKMGLAPLHNWLPDAHSEAPSLVSALLSGALLNCAFLGILRVQQILDAAGLGAFGRDLLLGMGLLSMAVAAVFVIRQGDYKRLLAYSSVEHMGILAIGVGIGGAGTFGALLHAINHSLTKAMLFLVAGNLLALYQSKRTSLVTGVLRRAPWSGALWLAGFLAVAGSPPFGTFLSEFTILSAALESGRAGVAVLYIALLAAVFAGMGRVVLGMLQGAATAPPRPEPWSAVLPPAVLGLAVLVLGLYVPPPLAEALELAARTLGGR